MSLETCLVVQQGLVYLVHPFRLEYPAHLEDLVLLLPQGLIHQELRVDLFRDKLKREEMRLFIRFHQINDSLMIYD